MKKLYHSLIILAGIVAVLASCQKEPCQKCLEAQKLSNSNEVEVSAALVGEDYVADGLTCPATLYVWNEEGICGKYDSIEGRFAMNLSEGLYDFAVTVNVPALSGAAISDLRNSILSLPEQGGFFLFGISKGVEVVSSASVTVPLSRSYSSQPSSNLF